MNQVKRHLSRSGLDDLLSFTQLPSAKNGYIRPLPCPSVAFSDLRSLGEGGLALRQKYSPLRCGYTSSYVCLQYFAEPQHSRKI